MNNFWPLAMLLILLALLFVMVPLLIKPRIRGVQRDALNIQVIKDQLVELQADLEAGRVDQSAYAGARHDLERELLDDVDAENVQVDMDAGRGRWLMLVLLVLMPVTSVGIYTLTGTANISQAPEVSAGAASSAAEVQHSIEEMITGLAANLQREPNNLEGWLMLGRSYAAMDRFSDAAEAYRHALQLSADDAELLSSYADVLVMLNHGEFTDQVGELLGRALASDPHHMKSLWLRGHWKVRRGDKSGAVEDWQMALAALPPGNENALAIQQQINQLQASAGQLVQQAAKPTAAAPEPIKADKNKTITVQVGLDPALADLASPEDTVFIFARATQGSRMPLAVVRKRVADLPVTVTLDDSLAMSPAMVLSKFEQVTLGARVSKSGQAIPASGDLQGSVSPVDVGGSEVQITIDQKVP